MIRLFILLTLISCGKKEPQKYITYKYDYIENPFDNTDNEDRFQLLENRINALDEVLTQNLADMYNLTQQLNAKVADLQELQADQTTTEEELEQAMSDIQTLGTLLAGIQNSINEQMAEIERLKDQLNEI